MFVSNWENIKTVAAYKPIPYLTKISFLNLYVQECDPDDLYSMLYASGCTNSEAIQILSSFHDNTKKG